METHVVRLWLPDRPGALGAVASRIGAVRGDVVGIDILERGAGRAIDELVVQVPDASLLDLLVREIQAVDGVDVEDVRPSDAPGDPSLDALEAAAALVAAADSAELLDALVEHAVRDFAADWAVVVDAESPRMRASAGEAPAPDPAWLAAFVAGSRSCEPVTAGESGPDQVAWALLPTAGLTLVLGRRGRSFRARERQQLAALARIADLRWADAS